MAAEHTNWLSLADVIALHVAVMRQTGVNPAPLRDEGLLESAGMRPQMAAHYEEADIIRQAALLAAGIAQAQAFVDGNKRTALAAMEAFLRVNGYTCGAESMELAYQIEALATRTDPLEAAIARFEQWLRGRSGPVSEPPVAPGDQRDG